MPTSITRRPYRAVLAIAAAVTVTATLSTAPAADAGARPAGATTWTNLWLDDFDGAAGTAPSAVNWRHITTGFGSGDVEQMTTSTQNVALDGRGDLRITALRDAAGNWTSGRIESNRDDFQPAVGKVLRVSARIEVPALTGAAGLGYWPAFWMLGTPLRAGGSWPDVGEYDILEDVNDQNLAYGTFHCGVNPGGPCRESTGLGGKRACPKTACAGSFHTYMLQWDRRSSPEELRWYVDGQEYWSVDAGQFDAGTWSDATHRSAYLIFDLAMGGAFPNGISGITTPTAATQSGGSMLVQYVRVDTT